MQLQQTLYLFECLVYSLEEIFWAGDWENDASLEGLYCGEIVWIGLEIYSLIFFGYYNGSFEAILTGYGFDCVCVASLCWGFCGGCDYDCGFYCDCDYDGELLHDFDQLLWEGLIDNCLLDSLR